MAACGSGPRLAQDVTVAVVTVRDGRLLCVEEHVDDGRSSGGRAIPPATVDPADTGKRLVLNQPAGHLEAGESLIEAAVRETREESGWNVGITALVGIHQWTSPTSGVHYLRFAFAAEALVPIPDAVLDQGIERALWMLPEELRSQSHRHRSPLVWRAVADFLGGSRYPLSLLHAFP